MASLHRLTAGPEDAGRRLDQVLPLRLPELSRARAQQLIEAGEVRVDGRPVIRGSQKLAAGAKVEVHVPDPVAPEAAPQPQDLPLPVLYEDAHLLVVDKPAGMAVHPGPGTPDQTVVNVVLHLVPDLPGINGEVRPGIVHRLDKDTTGLLVVAKTEQALGALQRQFKARTVEKIYLALVHGLPPSDAGVIETALGRHPVDRKRHTGKGDPQRTGARAARTRWKVVERFDHAALLEVCLDTGRTHQIRVHLSEAGHPLLGDALYGGVRRDRLSPGHGVREAAELLGHQALHAARLAFDHPVGGARLSFEAPPPAEWQAALAALRRP